MTKTARVAMALGAAGLSAACGDATAVPGPENLSLNFRVAGAAPTLAAGGPQMVAGPPMTLEGSNGSLTLDEVLLIINEVELKPEDGSCDAVSSDDDDDCPDWEAPPRFLDLPLDGEPIAAVTALIQPGTYKELDFEIEDLEDDEDDAEERAAIEALRTEILATVPDWPREASALITGSFTPTGGSPIAFRVFLEAEIEIEFELMPRLVVGEDGGVSRDLTVDVQPQAWFNRPDGTVLPLSDFDYDTTGELLEFELEMEDGFTEIEIEIG